MRHRLSRRIFAAVCGLWLAISLAEPAALHACAIHATQGHDHRHGSHHAGHERSGRTGSRHDHDAGATCTCPGGCCVAVPVAAPGAAPLVRAVIVAHVSRIVSPPALGHRPAVIEYARPPSIGPPAHTA